MVEMATNPLLAGALLVLLPPLGGALINGLLGRWTASRAHWPALLAMIAACVGSGLICIEVFGGGALNQDLCVWIRAGEVEIPVGLLIDPISAATLITLVLMGLAVHVYAVGEIAGARGYAGHFALLNLSVFAAALVLLANNYGMLCVGWALLGVCSYLSIELYGSGDGVRRAARRIFLVDRVGDIALALGALLMLSRLGDLSFEALEKGELTDETATWIGLLFLLAAAARAAQFPLHFWWADAVAGTASVNTLVHATAMGMVSVYLIVRSLPLYVASPLAAQLLIAIGGGTALLGAAMALASRDVKKVLAHSTSSQLGFMLALLGLGGSVVSHLLIHTLVKGLLFLGVGSVVRTAAGEREMDKLARPRRQTTFWALLIGAMALGGLPPFAGFWSYASLLLPLCETDQLIAWGGGCLFVGLTAFYGFRLLWGMFTAEKADGDARQMARPAASLVAPLVPLAILAAGGGLLSFLWGRGLIDEFFGLPATAPTNQGAWGMPFEALVGILAGTAVIGAVLAWLVYGKSPLQAAEWKRGPLKRLLESDCYIGALVEGVIVQPLRGIARFVRDVVDTLLIDLLCVDGSALAVRGLGWVLARLQTGRVRFYALTMVVGAAAILLFLTRS